MLRRLYLSFGKRLFDLCTAVLLLVPAVPVLLVIAVLNRFQIGRPVLFRQVRLGLNGKPFTIVKFSTMREMAGPDGKQLPDEMRSTRFGTFLRRYSLDEIPELFNVLRGDMSLVGPRPLLTQYLERYSAHQRRRHEVRPGISGWCQVNGRNALDWPAKFDLDVWYVDHVSFVLDVKILFLTFLHVVRPAGISHPGHSTMPEFVANQESDTHAR